MTTSATEEIQAAVRDARAVVGLFPSTSPWFWGDTDDPRRAIDCALEHGLRLFDTSPCYGWGEGERILGRATAGYSNAILMTKCGLRWRGGTGKVFLSVNDRGQCYSLRRDLRPESIRNECEASLRRLGRDVIDVYQCHWPDPAVGIDATMEALLRLRDEGKIRAIGLCNHPLDSVRRARTHSEIAVAQERLNVLYQHRVKQRLLDHYSAYTELLAYSPLQHGALAHRAEDEVAGARAGGDWFAEEGRDRIERAFTETSAIRREYGLSRAQLALAWTLGQPFVGGVIVGVRTEDHVREAVRIARLELPPGALTEIGKAFAVEARAAWEARQAS